MLGVRPNGFEFKEPRVSVIPLAATSLGALGAGLLLAVAYYTEAHRAPDQS
jgi:hypothetical protein